MEKQGCFQAFGKPWNCSFCMWIADAFTNCNLSFVIFVSVLFERARCDVYLIVLLKTKI